MNKHEIALRLAVAHSEKVPKRVPPEISTPEELNLHFAKLIVDFYKAIYDNLPLIED